MGKLRIGENVLECTQGDFGSAADRRCRPACRHRHGEGIADYISRGPVRDILHDEEEHIDWLETRLILVKDLGAERHLQNKTG